MEVQPRRCTNPQCTHPDKTTQDFYIDRANADGLKFWCKECTKASVRRWEKENPEKRKEQDRRRDKTPNRRAKSSERSSRWGKANPAHRIEMFRRRTYGISIEDQRKMWEVQSSRCLICTEALEYTKAHLDHHHESGQVRGFLCRSCNTAVGGGKDDPRLLRRAAAYVQAFKINPEQAHHTLLTLRKAGGF